MDIYFFGLTALLLKGKKTTIVVDPFEKTEADGVLITAKDASHIRLDQVSGYRVVIDGPGEYEVGGVSIVGFPIGDQTTYYIKMDAVSLLHLGQQSQPLTDTETERYPNIDILFLSVGRPPAQIIAKLEPKIVVPMYVDRATRDAFLKEVGKEEIKPQSKLSIIKDKLPAEMEVVVLGDS